MEKIGERTYYLPDLRLESLDGVDVGRCYVDADHICSLRDPF